MSSKDLKDIKDVVNTLTTAIVSAFGRDVALAVAKAIPEARPNVRVGVSALIRNGKGEFLVGERIGSHGAGKISSPLVTFVEFSICGG